MRTTKPLTFIKIKIGNHRTPETAVIPTNAARIHGSQKQLNAFVKLVTENKDIVFFCSNPFSSVKDVSEKLGGEVSLMFYKKDGFMWTCKITDEGKVKEMTKVPHPDMTQYNTANQSEQEHADELLPVINLNRKLGVTNYY